MMMMMLRMIRWDCHLTGKVKNLEKSQDGNKVGKCREVYKKSC